MSTGFSAKLPSLLFWVVLSACSADGSGDADDEDVVPGKVAACVLSESLPARCIEEIDCIACGFETAFLAATGDNRRLQFQLPKGTPPSTGWPAVILFQGTGFGGEIMWASAVSEPFGGFHETRLIAALLENGYAVLTPETLGEGRTYWQTNVFNQVNNWEASADHAMMLALFEAIEAGQFGPLDAASLQAAGISSGGFMTSRMAVSYPGKFRSLAIQSAGYASFPVASMPATLPADHPPTLFLHGAADFIVPIAAASGYHRALVEMGIAASLVEDDVGHQWLPEAPDRIVEWFDR